MQSSLPDAVLQAQRLYIEQLLLLMLQYFTVVVVVAGAAVLYREACVLPWIVGAARTCMCLIDHTHHSMHYYYLSTVNELFVDSETTARPVQVPLNWSTSYNASSDKQVNNELDFRSRFFQGYSNHPV